MSAIRILLFAVLFGRLLTDCAIADPLPWIRVSEDRSHFTVGDARKEFRPMGFNYDHDADGRLIEDYWHVEWDRVENDFHDMKQLGASVVRVHLQFGKFMSSATEARDAELKQLGRLLELAERTQLYVDLTGLGCYHKQDVPEWYDALDEQARWKAQAVFWEAVSSVCRDSAAVFCYDLMNEPVIGGETAAKDWLGPPFAGKHFVQFVARQTNGRTRPDAAKQWIDQMVAAIRRHDTRHLVTVGFVDWSLDRPGLTSGFVPEKVAQNLDFLAVHIYPQAGKVEEALEKLKGFQIGKPVIVEETFPLGCSMEELESFIERSGEQADGWISFFWGKMPEEYQPDGSIGDAIISEWLKKFSERMKAVVEDSAASAEQALHTSPVVRNCVEHFRLHPGGTAAFTIDISAWSTERDDRNLPIGVFDSGIGGLTVLEAILAMDQFQNDSFAPGPDGVADFENERFIYFGDQANMPYGNYPPAGRPDFLKELILKDAAFLLGRRWRADSTSEHPRFDKPPVKAIVIACNTATAWGLAEIREVTEALRIPVLVIGVVDAGARGVMEKTQNDGPPRTVAVLATVGTCASNAYPKAIGRTMGLAGKRIPTVIQQGSVGLAGAIEGDPAFILPDELTTNETTGSVRPAYRGPGFANAAAPLDPAAIRIYGFDSNGLIGHPANPESQHLNSVSNYIRYDVAELIRTYQLSRPTAPIDTVVLGCTHFPLVEKEILGAFARLRTYEENGVRPFQSLIAESIDVVDPAEMTAKELFWELARNNLFSTDAAGQTPEHDLFFMSVANPRCSEAIRSPDGSLDPDYKYGRRAGQWQIEDTICVPLELSLLSASSVNLIRTHLPEVWDRLTPAENP